MHTNSVMRISAIYNGFSFTKCVILILTSYSSILTNVSAIQSTLDIETNPISPISLSMMTSNNNNNTNNNMQTPKTQEQMAEGQSPPLSTSFSFNPDMPLTIPLVDGYYNGTRVFFIHTETSDKNMADMMTEMINFPTLYVPELTEGIGEENLSKVYVFTNGVPGSGPYGGGPFMFQIDIFDSIPGQENYTHLRAPYLVTWNDNATARILTSVEDIVNARENGEVTIQRADNIVVNAPILAWSVPEDSISGGDSNSIKIGSNSNNQTADANKTSTTVDKIFLSMPNFEGQVIHIDADHYMARIKLNPIK